MKSRILAVLLVVIAIAPAIILGYYYQSTHVAMSDNPIASMEFSHTQTLETGSEFDVKACKVLDGFRYDMYLEGGKWIEAHLAVATKDEANVIVVELLNATTSPPTVRLLKQVGNYWIVDFYLTVDGKRANMVDVLQEKQLLL